MKIKALFVVGLFILGLMFIAPQASESQELLYANTTIDRINHNSSFALLFMSEVNGVFTNKRFRFENQEVENMMMAIALTAASMDKTIRVGFYDGNPARVVVFGYLE